MPLLQGADESPSFWENVGNWFLSTGIRVIVIIVASYAIYRVLKLIIHRAVELYIRRNQKRHTSFWVQNRSRTLSSALITTAGVVIGIIALFLILPEFGINIAPLLAGAGVVGLAISFGAQSLIKDMLNGIFILLEDQLNLGDVVKIADITGTVEEINLRRIVLRDLDGAVHTVPNGQITTVSNFTRDWARVNLDIPVSYGEDLSHVMSVINRVGNELAQDPNFGPKIKTPPQSLRVNKFGDSGIEIKVLGETRPSMQWEVTGELRRRLKVAFDQEGIEIPWPHVKLYFGNTPPGGDRLICPQCHFPNPTESHYCGGCGLELKSEPASARSEEKPIEP